MQTFFQSFILVLIALAWFQGSLLVNLLTVAWFPLVNLLLFIYWVPVLVCLLGARYRDIYQLVPIVLQLIFLLSPILYEKNNLGPLSWTADFNPIYRVLSPLRHSLIEGRMLGWQDIVLFVANILGVLVAIWLLNRERRHLPFLI
jgi:lipopolysaccharide transport system permease protein